ncbi:class I SAM-dependent methyltransferase [Cyclobacterium sp.]|uniref:class I SAM-dependent methyltransferase n=1 Tax=Cyclobacterium sp. TaxID=1966343 RepID=UPI0019AC93BB|nr:class I SAM-dependent methyltransferase [Cyclobacterium sp.]MBD3628019.1 class I SAM-dependent methyltransferase [Cyclobacterium sp.]
MNELELLITLHKNSDRLGPGSEADTLKALEFIPLPQDRKLKVADLGCGTGAQTITLARNLSGQITAVDLFPAFLDELTKKSKHLGLTNQINTLCTSMDELPFGNGEFDLIWSEGAIYNIGFESGIKHWKNFLKTGGYLALSEITWISPVRPKEIEDYWHQVYPEIATASDKIRILERNGFSPVAYFYLSPESWTNHYYKPLEKRFAAFLDQLAHSELAKKVVEDTKMEMEWYQKYKDHYSYGFYIAKKI